MTEFAAVSRPYAQAVFELARESGDMESWSKVLSAAAELIQMDEISALLEVPGIERDEIAGLLTEACRRETGVASEQVSNLMRLLAENQRFGALPAISESFSQLRAEAENVVDVVLTAATPVDSDRQQKIADALKTRLGRDINLRFQQDENLIGGARLTADDLVIDGSVRTGLSKLATALTS